VIKVTRKGGKTGRVPLPAQAVRALDDYLETRTDGPILLAANGMTRHPHKSACEQMRRLCKAAGLPDGVTPHSPRHSFATEGLRLGTALQDVQDALGHADPRTIRRYDRSRYNLDRSPNYLLTTALTSDCDRSL
jgi:integrase/recombinase XerD